ncbi:peroxin [Tieghemiomyces parasiticus]|uniref:Peroxin n=1 Tax=Tieghemiomyces parasiticus TaxID=78921 RepID=A0A9W8DZC0_9FUNG|nr:peroxin [Tieghemiomyces parasiticus]
MFSSVYGYAKRHRKTMFITAGVVAGVYWVGQYAKRKLTEMQAAMAKDRMWQENLRRRFEQNQQDCTFTVMSLLPTLCEPILDAMNVEKLVQTLKEYRKGPILDTSPLPTEDSAAGVDDVAAAAQATLGSSPALGSPSALTIVDAAVHPPKTKVELWEEIKLGSFTRLLTSLYCLNFLTIFVYLQLNLIGRFIYIDSVVTLAQEEAMGSEASGPAQVPHLPPSVLDATVPTPGKTGRRLPFALEQGYLTLTWWILHEGWRTVHAQVVEAVEETLGSVSLKSKLTHIELVDLLAVIRAKVERDGDRGALRERFRGCLWPRDPGVGEGTAETRTNDDPNGEEEEEAIDLSPAEEAGLRRTLREGGASVAILKEPTFRRILTETRDFLESDDFELVSQRCLDRTFSLLYETLHQYFPERPPAHPSMQPVSTRSGGGGNDTYARAASQTDLAASFISATTAPDSAARDSTPVDLVEEFESFSVIEPRLALATLIPRVTREVHQVLNGFPNTYLEAITAVPELQAFSAVIYTSLEL